MVGEVVGDVPGEGLVVVSPPPSPQAPKAAAKLSTKARPITFLFIHSSFTNDGKDNNLLIEDSTVQAVIPRSSNSSTEIAAIA